MTNRNGIKINSFNSAEKQEEALKILSTYPHTAEELSQELDLSLENTRTVLKQLERQHLIWCTKRRYRVKGNA